jgi:hypothetical protein
MLSIPFKTRGYSVTNSRLYNTTNTNTFNKECKNCNTSNQVTYVPLKTMRKTDNISQKMKYGAFVRRAQENTISYYDTLQFQYRNL